MTNNKNRYACADAIIVAAGSGRRMGAGMNKVFLPLLGQEMLRYTLQVFQNHDKIAGIIVVTGKDDLLRCRRICEDFDKVQTVTEGGATRQESVLLGLAHCKNDYVAVHDGARALLSAEEISLVITDAVSFGAAALGVPCKDTLKTADENGVICGTIDRERTFLIQTPQVFKREVLLSLHQRAAADGICVTDDCGLGEIYGVPVKITTGSYNNLKLTTPEDMAVAETILRSKK